VKPLGVFQPAIDTSFRDSKKPIQPFWAEQQIVARLLAFTREHRSKLLAEQGAIGRIGGIKYPFMKLVDMYFWQIGAGISDQKQNAELELVA
jgi:hypothetical protein